MTFLVPFGSLKIFEPSSSKSISFPQNNENGQIITNHPFPSRGNTHHCPQQSFSTLETWASSKILAAPALPHFHSSLPPYFYFYSNLNITHSFYKNLILLFYFLYSPLVVLPLSKTINSKETLFFFFCLFGLVLFCFSCCSEWWILLLLPQTLWMASTLSWQGE